MLFTSLLSNRITADIYNDPAGVFDPLTNTPRRRDEAFGRRRQILTDFYCRRFQKNMIDTRPVGIMFANGDVMMDVALAWRLYKESGSTSYLMIVCEIYGIVDLITGSHKMPRRKPGLQQESYTLKLP